MEFLHSFAFLVDFDFASAHPFIYAGLAILGLPFLTLFAVCAAYNLAFVCLGVRYFARSIWRGLAPAAWQ